VLLRAGEGGKKLHHGLVTPNLVDPFLGILQGIQKIPQPVLGAEPPRHLDQLGFVF